MRTLLLAFLLGILTVTAYRLPKDVIPENYKLEILTYLGVKDNFGFEGNVAIQTHCVQPAANITLHSKDLTIKDKDVKVHDISSNSEKEVKIKNILFDKKQDFLTIVLDSPLEEDHEYEIRIKFNSTLNDGLSGFYRSSYTDKETKEKKWVAVTQFEAISARMAFPCFDEPEMKATFDISIGRKEGLHTISNMPLRETEPVKEKEGFYWDRFDTSVPMSTYLVAFLVSDFEHKTAEPTKDSNVTFSIWARKNALDQVEFAKDVGPKFLEFFENYFDVKYPLPKQDMAALSDFSAGAMENWGLITYREAYLLYDPKVSSKTNQFSVASVIAHELAHQWFGNLVTMKWWTDLWLNEGFATYMAAVAVDNLFPQWNSWEEESATNMVNVFSFDALKSSHPVSVPIGDPKEIDEIFDTISYKKGSSLIRMMMLFLSDPVLRKGVSQYLKKHQYGNAEQDDLWESLTDEAHNQGTLPKNLTVKTIMDTWTVQTGYPVINVERNYKDKSAKITQKRFLKDAEDSKKEKSCWWVPLSYSTQSAPHFNETVPKHWLPCPLEEAILKDVANEDEWVIFNNQIAGIYKVNYDEKNWKLITQALKAEDFHKINVLNRVQLISDAGDLAFIGKLKYDVFFNLVQYLQQEDNFLPWKTALVHIGKIDGYLEDKPIYAEFKEYMKQLLGPMYGKVGGFHIVQTKSDQLQSIKLQVKITGKSCRFDVENCVTEAQQQFQEYIKSVEAGNKENPISTDLKGVVYCTALKHGDEKEWNFLWKQYLNSNVASEKNLILSSLGCTKNKKILKEYLDKTLDKSSGIRVQDVSQVFGAVARNDVGFPIAKKFFYDNIKTIAEILKPSKRLGRYLGTLAHGIKTEEGEKEFMKVLDEHKTVFEGLKQNVQQALETIKVNIQWEKKHSSQLEKILPKYYKHL